MQVSRHFMPLPRTNHGKSYNTKSLASLRSHPVARSHGHGRLWRWGATAPERAVVEEMWVMIWRLWCCVPTIDDWWTFDDDV